MKRGCCRVQKDIGGRIGLRTRSDPVGAVDPGDSPLGRCACSPIDPIVVESVPLRRGALHVTEAARTCKIACIEGTVWVTCSNRLSDYVLNAGEDLLLRGRNKVIATAGGGKALVQICRA